MMGEEDNEPTNQELTIDDQSGARDRIRMANLENPSSKTTPTIVGTTPSVFEATSVSVEAIPMVSPEVDLYVSVLPVVELVLMF